MAQMDRNVLVTLYEATCGAAWTINAHWNSSAPLSDWYGVRLNTQGRVEKLLLNDNNLQGIFANTPRAISLTFQKKLQPVVTLP